jgi:hypothetical protein
MSSPESLTGVVAAHSPDGTERLRAERPGSHGTTRSVSLTDDCALRHRGLNLRIATQMSSSAGADAGADAGPR